MIPKTQSVCKHCGEPRTSYIHAPDLSDRAHVFEPVSEPASTGEPPPDRYDELQRAGCLVGCYWNYLDSPNQFIEHVEGCPNKIPAARPSEPSAPTVEPIIHARTKVSEGEHLSAPRKSAIEIAGERDLRVITEPIDWEAVENDAAPQTSAEQIEEKLFLYNKEGFEKMPAPQPVSGDAPEWIVSAGREIFTKRLTDSLAIQHVIYKYWLAAPAPSPTRSVSTTQERLLKIADEIEQWANARQKTLPSRGDWNRWPTMIRECAAAPSVAGTQPHLRHRIADLLKIASSSEGGPSEDAVFDYVKALAGAAQGTPQVEEISREIAEKLAAMHLIVWQGLGQAMDEYAKEAAAILRKHGVGAPAQPGPQTRFDDFDDANHPCNKWWQEHGQFMMSGGGRREFIWACRGWIAREQLAEGVEVTGESMHESKPAPAQGTPEPPKVEEFVQTLSRLAGLTEEQSSNVAETLTHSLRRCFRPASPCEHEKLIQQQIEKRMEVLLDDNCIETIKRLAPEGGEEIFFGGVMGGIKLKWNGATPASTARTDQQLYVISVTGDGGQTTIVPESLLKSEIHKVYCSCGKDWQKCSDEVITNTIAKLDDAEEWTQNYPSYERHVWLDHGEDYTVQVMRVSAPGSVPQAPNNHSDLFFGNLQYSLQTLFAKVGNPFKDLAEWGAVWEALESARKRVGVPQAEPPKEEKQ